MTLRSLLFVPGDSEKKLAKGAEAGADALILDIEDLVAPARKPVARGMVAAYLGARPTGAAAPELWVRMNPIDQGGLDDLVAIIRARPDGILVPKVNHPNELIGLSCFIDALERRDGIQTPTRLLALATETARGPFGLGAYADTPLPRLWGLTWGAEDLSSAIGATTNRDPGGGYAFTFRMARSLCLLAAKACGAAAIETVFTDFRDTAGLKSDSEEANREGFVGRFAIHPAQVATINAAFTPPAEEVAFAERVVAAFAAAPGTGVVGLDGKMLDIPHLKQAQQVIARARALAGRGKR